MLVVTTLVAVIAFVVYYHYDTQIDPPRVNERLVNNFKREQLGPNHFAIGNNWLRKNEHGLWEMYVEGSAFERGVVSGKLTKELIDNQEKAFVDQIKEMIPSESYLDFLKYFIKFFNRDIDENIPQEFQEEIYGISFSASKQFEFIGTNYERMLNYHAAHDIGHALQDLMLVGCTSFASNMGFSDSSLIIGRNFDFYINDAFAEDKIVCFVNPDKGHQFAFVTWASFIGVVSGMNKKGLTVTINAGKSDIPFKSATPISLLAREILQYAANIEDAIAIAKKRKIFVSESLLIGSAADNKTVIIEKSPSKIGIYKTRADWLVCSNHFQSDAFQNDVANYEHMVNTATAYRQRRAGEMLAMYDTLFPADAAAILRDHSGIDGENIGIGNEKTMAQMISHHSVIFQPLKQNMWVSTQPYQLGKYLGYNLKSVFEFPQITKSPGISDTTLSIPADPFLYSKAYTDFLLFREKSDHIIQITKEGKRMKNDNDVIKNYISLNPGYYKSYVIAGDYYAAIDSTAKAERFYKFSMTKEFEKNSQRQETENKIKNLQN